MVYKLFYTKSAEKDLDGIEKKQTIKILLKVDGFLKLQDPLIKSKKLRGFELDTYRFRIGDYRVVFRLDHESKKIVILVVLKIAHRKEVYKKI